MAKMNIISFYLNTVEPNEMPEINGTHLREIRDEAAYYSLTFNNYHYQANIDVGGTSTEVVLKRYSQFSAAMLMHEMGMSVADIQSEIDKEYP